MSNLLAKMSMPLSPKPFIVCVEELAKAPFHNVFTHCQFIVTYDVMSPPCHRIPFVIVLTHEFYLVFDVPMFLMLVFT